MGTAGLTTSCSTADKIRMALCYRCGLSADRPKQWVAVAIYQCSDNEHLLTKDVHAVLIWDQAGFHKSKQLKIPDNITIIPLPPYSPELNPVENLWHYLRNHYWSNRAYVGYDDLRFAAIEAWQKAALKPEIIKSVCRAKYIERNY